MTDPTYDAPDFDPTDYNTIEQIAAVAAPIFALNNWRYGSDWREPPTDFVPDAEHLEGTLSRLYDGHAKRPMASVGSGRFVLIDDNPHDGTSVLHEGVRVFLDLGELPPRHGDEISTDSDSREPV